MDARKIKRIPINRVCYSCGSNKTWEDKNGCAFWRSHDNNWYCTKCNNKLFLNPKWNKINKQRRIRFKNKQIQVKYPPRNGICQWCGAVKGMDCKLTLIHHMTYHEEDPLKDTVELCTICHNKEHERLKKV